MRREDVPVGGVSDRFPLVMLRSTEDPEEENLGCKRQALKSNKTQREEPIHFP